MKNNKSVQEPEQEQRKIVFRVKIKDGFEGAGAWREFEVEDLFEGGKESGTFHGAFDWNTKSLRSPWKDLAGKWIFEGDIIKQPGIIISSNPEHQFAVASGIVAWTKDGFRVVPIGKLLPVIAKSTITGHNYHDFVRCAVCDGKKRIQVKCKPECAGLTYGCTPYPGCLGMLEEPCPVCGGG